MKQLSIISAIFAIALVVPLALNTAISSGSSSKKFDPPCIAAGTCLDTSSIPEICKEEQSDKRQPDYAKAEGKARSTCVWPLETEEELAMTAEERKNYVKELKRMAKEHPNGYDTGCLDSTIPGNQDRIDRGEQLATCNPAATGPGQKR